MPNVKQVLFLNGSVVLLFCCFLKTCFSRKRLDAHALPLGLSSVFLDSVKLKVSEGLSLSRQRRGAKQPSAPVAARRRQDTEVNEGCFLPGPGPEGEGSEASFHAVLHCLDERNDFPSLHSPPDPQALRICTKAFVNFCDTTLDE